MAHLIKNRRILCDDWRVLNRDIGRLLRTAEDGLLPDFPDRADLIVPTLLWRIRGEELLERSGATGVWLDSNEHPESIAAALSTLQVVAVNFPNGSDERGCATARLLRERYGYRGELRAIGDVSCDRLHHLSSCGFDAFALRADQDPLQALCALEEPSQDGKVAA